MAEPRSPLWQALRARDLAEMFRLLNSGADINEQNEYGDSLLSEAIFEFADLPDRGQIIGEMLRRGADPRLLDEEKCGPLLDAAIIKDATIMRMLLEAGADPNREFGCAGTVALYEWALSDYRCDEDLLNPPDEPSPQEKETEDGWLSYIERMAVKYGKPPPDYVRVLREHGAKTGWELEEQAKRNGMPSPCQHGTAGPE